MDDHTLGLKPTDILGPWHDFSAAELAEFDQPFAPEPVPRPFDPDDFRARCEPVGEDGMNASALWGKLYRLEWAGLAEAQQWLTHAASGPASYHIATVPSDFFHQAPTVAADASLPELIAMIQGLRFFGSMHTRWARMMRPFGEFLDVVRAIIDGVDGYEAMQWLVALGPPPAAVREEAAHIVETYVRSMADPFGSLNVRAEYGDLAAVYPTPYLVRMAFEVASSGYFWNTERLWTRLQEPADILACSDMMAGGKHLSPAPEDVRFFIARFGPGDLESLMQRVLRRNSAKYDEAVYAEAFRVRHPGWVELLQPLAGRRKSAPLVDAYLRNEGINAIEGLLRMAAGRGKKRLWALDWLATLSADPQMAAWIEARLPHHPDVADAVDERLGTEAKRETVTPDWATGAAPKWSWLDPARLEVALVHKGALAPESLAAALTSGADLSAEISNISDVLWSVTEQWWFREEGAEQLMAFFVRHAGEDDIVRLVEAVASRHAWPRRKAGHPQRILAMRTVAAVDHPLARRGLLQFTNIYSETLRKVAIELVEQQLAATRESSDEFADRAVPSLGLDVRGERVFDYGGRLIRLVVRGRNDIAFIDDSTQQSYDRLPATRKTDDARLVQQHRETWKLIRTPLLNVFADEADRLEAAMVRERSWSASTFSEFLRHPVLGHLARRIIWLVDDVPCLVAQEGDACDVNLDAVTIAADSTLRVAHPAQLDVGAWAEVLADQEIVQPFEQLRDVPEVDVRAVKLGSEALIDAAISTWHFANREHDALSNLSMNGVTLVLEPGLTTTNHGRRGRYQPQTQTIVDIIGEPTVVQAHEIRRLVNVARM